jgi:hypothetical protein
MNFNFNFKTKKIQIQMLWKKTTPFDGSGFCTLTHTPVKPICTKIVLRSNFNGFQIKGYGIFRLFNFNFKTIKIQNQMLWKKTTPFYGSGFCTLTHTPVKPICTKIVLRSNFNVFQILSELENI